MGLIGDIITNFQEERTKRIQARQERKAARTQARQERKAVESLTGRSGGTGSAWAQTVGNLTEGLAGLFTGGYSASNTRTSASSPGETRRQTQEDNSLLIYGGLGLVVVLVIVFVIMKNKKK